MMPLTGYPTQMRSFQNASPAFASELPYTAPSYLIQHQNPPAPRPSHIPSSRPVQIQPPTCRVCSHLLDLAEVRNNNRNKGRPYYRCNKCGVFRRWADGVGISNQNPLCRCGEYTRVDVSKEGIRYFDCAEKRCGFYAEKNWRDDDVRGGYKYEPQVPELRGSAAW
ncbi:hypothetical protein BJX63DRAFT_98817 [Aspergillus granulosus]|uniref:GRF-like zinc ribbon domain-containing protein n=1 Tax=Aspergillus granulosus TaxID=176169 RepID=A0ABR4GWB0_9EURO